MPLAKFIKQIKKFTWHENCIRLDRSHLMRKSFPYKISARKTLNYTNVNITHAFYFMKPLFLQFINCFHLSLSHARKRSD